VVSSPLTQEPTSKSDLKQAQQLIEGKQFETARTLLVELRDKYPEDDELLYMLAVCYRYLLDYPNALKTLDTLKKCSPDHGRAHQETGHVYRSMKQFDFAMNAYATATTINPALTSSFRAQIEILKKTDRGHMTTQLEEHLEMLGGLPKALVAVTDLIGQKRYIHAEQVCKRFMLQSPRHIEGMRLLAIIASKLGVIDDAEFLLESALAFEPKNNRVRVEYIQVLRKRQKYVEALENARSLLSSNPNSPQFQSVYAVESLQSGHYETALEMFDSILQTVPEDPITLTSKGHALKTLGRTSEAIDSYRRAIRRYPGHGEAFYSLANLKLFTFEEDEIRLMESMRDGEAMSHMNRIYLNFALGKAYEDKNCFDEAFACYDSGNGLKRAQSKYSERELIAEFQSQVKVFDEAFASAVSRGGCDEPDPIFVVGMPRAGSTLLEQILASHSLVDGTMELPNILTFVHKLRRGERLSLVNHYPEVLTKMNNEQFKELGMRYIDETRSHRGNAPFFVDKMPNNFAHIGLILAILPNAKIIDARRHPMACCFSGFKQLFAEGQEFSYGLEQIGSYYKSYVELMAHWDRVFPKKVLKVNYEDVIDDLEVQVRRILHFCGLPFEEQCLSFYTTERAVRTPSSEQVRKPIYRGGVEQYKKFEKHLGPLKMALGEALLDESKNTHKLASSKDNCFTTI